MKWDFRLSEWDVAMGWVYCKIDQLLLLYTKSVHLALMDEVELFCFLGLCVLEPSVPETLKTLAVRSSRKSFWIFSSTNSKNAIHEGLLSSLRGHQ